MYISPYVVITCTACQYEPSSEPVDLKAARWHVCQCHYLCLKQGAGSLLVITPGGRGSSGPALIGGCPASAQCCSILLGIHPKDGLVDGAASWHDPADCHRYTTVCSFQHQPACATIYDVML